MKYIIASLLLVQAAAFTAIRPSARAPTHIAAAEYEKMDGEGKINLKVSKYRVGELPTKGNMNEWLLGDSNKSSDTG